MSRRKRIRVHDHERTYVEKFDYWRCPRCNVWYDDTFAVCEMCEHKRVHVTHVAYECQDCLCIYTVASMHLHDCGGCSF